MESRFLANPGNEHSNAVKWILRYLNGSSEFYLCFDDDKYILEEYTDSDMAGGIDTQKSIRDTYLLCRGVVLWQSKLLNVLLYPLLDPRSTSTKTSERKLCKKRSITCIRTMERKKSGFGLRFISRTNALL